MYEDLVLKKDENSSASNNLDNLFNNLTNDISTFNKYVDNVNRQKIENTKEEKELLEEKQKIAKARIEFEEYVKTQQAEYNKKQEQIEEYLNSQRQNILKSEEDFKRSIETTLNEIEISKKEIEIQKDKLKYDQEQFESYKNLELERIKHSQAILETDKIQFEKYKEIATQKIELENKGIEQKCERIKGFIGQINSSFKPIVEENKEV